MKQRTKIKTTRRQLLQGAGASALITAFPTIVPSSVFGQNAPSKRVTIGMIGVGRQGTLVNLKTLVNMDGVQVVAVCDVDQWRLRAAKALVDQKYGDSGCHAMPDWREVIGRSDVDAIMNSTPDHWHVPISLAAVRSGKHVSCEKPLTLSVAEGRMLADAVKQQGVVFRTDSECQSDAYMHKTVELVRNGYIGGIKRFEVGVPRGDAAGGSATPVPVPEGLDYEMWMGPIKQKPYMLDAVHPVQSYGRPGWMRCRDTCEGMITNWGTHVIDVAQKVNNSQRTGPVSVEGSGSYPDPGSGLWNVLVDFKVQYQYADGVIMDYKIDSEGAYLRVEGEEGWIQSNWHRKGGLQASDANILKAKFKGSEIRFPNRSDKGDFIHCIRNNAPQESMADAEVGHRTCSMGQIAHIAIQRKAKLVWNPEQEVFPDDEQANQMLRREYREPWG
ncbi:MAG: Gfo/Idh/MocA family oxidoreductase [Kiritimatiellae bacterium]|nr:Gfo/Idh/MocA family oxidoreductase [Kiritimatiellia bacterium]